MRLYAEFDNFRRRTAQEKEELAKYATEGFVRELLPLMDNFERARASFEKHENEVDELKNGLILIHKQFEDILKNSGVEKIEVAGKPFDLSFS